MVSLVPILQAKLEWEHEEQDDESQSYADGNPAPGFGLVGRVNGALVVPSGKPAVYPESTEGGRRVSILKWPEGALLNLG